MPRREPKKLDGACGLTTRCAAAPPLRPSKLATTHHAPRRAAQRKANKSEADRRYNAERAEVLRAEGRRWREIATERLSVAIHTSDVLSLLREPLEEGEVATPALVASLSGTESGMEIESGEE